MSAKCSVCVRPADFSVTPYIQSVYEDQVLPETVGTTLAVNHRSYQIMSDMWEDGLEAVFWDDANGRVIRRQVLEGTVDATPETLEKVRAKMIFDSVASSVSVLTADRAKIAKGDVIRVVKGRSGKGSEGKVVVIMTANYRAGWHSEAELKYGIALDDVKVPVYKNGKVFENYANMVWAYARNVEKVTPNVPVTAEEILEIRENAEKNSWGWLKREYPDLFRVQACYAKKVVPDP